MGAVCILLQWVWVIHGLNLSSPYFSFLDGGVGFTGHAAGSVPVEKRVKMLLPAPDSIKVHVQQIILQME